jgi:hypothetical protein
MILQNLILKVMSKPKGKQSVRSAVQRLYPEMPLRFSMISLHAMVAREINRPYVFMDTIRRKLFELREEGLIKFENVDKAKSIYHKLERL